MARDAKVKQVVARFDKKSYDKISEYAKIEHRGLGEFVRHATLHYIENFEQTTQKESKRPEIEAPE